MQKETVLRIQRKREKEREFRRKGGGREEGAFSLEWFTKDY